MLDLEHGILMFIFGTSITLIGFFIAYLIIMRNYRKEQKRQCILAAFCSSKRCESQRNTNY